MSVPRGYNASIVVSVATLAFVCNGIDRNLRVLHPLLPPPNMALEISAFIFCGLQFFLCSFVPGVILVVVSWTRS